MPWFREVSGRTVTFTDGRQIKADAILAGTGFDLHLPFLSDDISRTVQNDRKGLQLAELPSIQTCRVWLCRSLGPAGFVPCAVGTTGTLFAYTWGNVIPAPTDREMREALQACADEDHHGDYQNQNAMALRFARLCGTDPANLDDPALLAKSRESATTGIL